MSVYLGRNRPRRQTISAVKIHDPERYDRYYDIAFDALQKRIFPRVTLPAGQLVIRQSESGYNARQIPPGNSKKTTNRFSGLRLDGHPGQGALYIGTVAGVLREYTHYSVQEKLIKTGVATRPAVLTPGSPMVRGPIWSPSAADKTADFMQQQRAGASPAGAKHQFFLFRVNRTLQFADLRITSLAPFMSQVRASGAQRYGIDSGAPVDFLATAASGPDDYSAARGIADAVFDLQPQTGLAGVCAFSARADQDSGVVVMSFDGDRTGGLVYAIFGPDLSEVSALTAVPRSPSDPGFPTFAELIAKVRSLP